MVMRSPDDHLVHQPGSYVSRPYTVIRFQPCSPGRKRMMWLYITSGALVVFLLGYLIYALLRPEDF